jgi:two-component sensor histidine kinase/DNA-binding response OmpR family regulator
MVAPLSSAMEQHDKVNILLVDDQPAKLVSYEVVLHELDENLIKADSATEALQVLLKNEIAVILVDVCMPDLDGFELAAMIRGHPRFQRTAIIFISAIHLTDTDYLRGYEMGGVDYVPVPVVPELLRAKVRVFAELYRKTRQLEKLNQELERRVAERTAEVESSAERLRESERSRSIALAAGQMGSWEWEIGTGECTCDAGQLRIFGIEPSDEPLTIEEIRKLIPPDDFSRLEKLIAEGAGEQTFQAEVGIVRSDEETRHCACTGAITADAEGRAIFVSIVMLDITDRKQAEARQLLLAREVDHRARNALAVVQAIVRLTHANSQEGYVAAVEGRIHALAQAHTLLSETRWQGAHLERLVTEELAPYRSANSPRVVIGGPSVFLSAEKAQNLALALHELATNSAKYGALSAANGILAVNWQSEPGVVTLHWQESDGPPVAAPGSQGFGTKIMNASIKHQLGGNVTWDWRSSGLHCTLQIPVGMEGNLPKGALPHAGENLVKLPTGTMRRVLLAEDEAIIGMMMREFLLEYGVFVVGPCCTLRETLAAASTEFDCAILDLNLGGESVYPAASALVECNVPFAFVTGYGRESLDGRFANVPILQKPITRESLENCLRDMLERQPDHRNPNRSSGESARDAPSVLRA